MSLVCDYFVAADDAAAAGTAAWPGGPSDPPGPSRGLFRRSAAPVGPRLPTVQLPGLEPVVLLGTLESLLTGGDADDLVAANAAAQVNAGDDQVMVFRLSPGLLDALVRAPAERVREVVVRWSQTDELADDGDPAALAEALDRLAGLAGGARDTGGAVYCWTSA